ncbi:MAG: cell wall hydrolase [Pseudomonadota bacterium]
MRRGLVAIAINRVLAAAAITGALSSPGLTNEPPADIALQIEAIMAQERAARTAVAADRLRELGNSDPMTTPETAPRPRPSVNLAALNRMDAEAMRLADDAQRRMLSRDDRYALLSFSKDELDLLPDAEGDAQWRCLSEALYFEARGESVAGQVAVAEVILNRVEHARYPDTVCAVVKQNQHMRNRCQFSYMCDGKPELITEHRAFARAMKIARIMLDGQPRVLTAGATHFHTRYINPSWSRKLTRTARIGAHIFFRL